LENAAVWVTDIEVPDGGISMSRERRSFTGAEKIIILREHLIEKVPISDVCEKHGMKPTLFYQWQKKLFEDGAGVFEQSRGKPLTGAWSVKGKPDRRQAAETRRIEALQAKLQQKNEVLAELMGEHVALKKTLGEL
jgi:transposase-like protein